MNIPDKAVEWFDKLKTISKIGILILVVIIAGLYSDYTGYLENISIQSKSESITTLKHLQQENSEDLRIRKYTDSIIIKIINDKPITFYLSESLEGYTNSIIKNNSSINSQFIFYNFYFHLCAAGGFYFLSVVAFLAMLFLGEEKNWLSRFQQSIGVAMILFVLSVFVTFLLSLIPVLPIGSFKTNYLIALTVQFIMFYGLYRFGKDKKEDVKK